MNKQDILQAMWNELYKQENEYEKRFIEDPNLDVSDWILYRHWFQLGHAIGIKVISEQMEDKPEVVMCGDCKYGHLVGSGFCECKKNGGAHYRDWYCADGQFAIIENRR